MDEPHRSTAPSVRVRHGLGDARRPITVIHVLGEHDFASRALLASALEPLQGHVVVDLAACTFIDTSVIGAIIGKALALGKVGQRLEVVVPPTGGFVSRTVERLGVRTLLPVVDAPPATSGRAAG
jgi:anti-anti-sigma regulatory factor